MPKECEFRGWSSMYISHDWFVHELNIDESLLVLVGRGHTTRCSVIAILSSPIVVY